MNPRQRRGLLLLAASVVGAVAVFAVVASYVGSVSSTVGPMSTVFVASRTIAPQQAVDADDVVPEQVPTRYVTPSTVLEEGDFLGYKSIQGISKGTWLQKDLIEPASSVADGERPVKFTDIRSIARSKFDPDIDGGWPGAASAIPGRRDAPIAARLPAAVRP